MIKDIATVIFGLVVILKVHMVFGGKPLIIWITK